MGRILEQMIYNPTREQAEPCLKASQYLSVDLETKGLDFLRDRIVMLIITTDADESFVWDVRKAFPMWVAKYLESRDYIKIIQNGLFDCCFLLWQHNILVQRIRDTMLQEQVIQGVFIPRIEKNEKIKQRYSASLKYQLQRYGLQYKKEFKIEIPDSDLVLPVALSFKYWPDNKPFHPLQISYGVGDTSQLLDLHIKQWEKIKAEKLVRVAQLENEALEAFVQMRVNGLSFRKDIWLEIAERYKEEANKDLIKLNRIAAGYGVQGINWNSPAQVKKFFAAHYGIFIKTFKQMDKKFKGKHPHLDLYIHLRSLYYAVKTFGPGWLRENDKKGRAPVIGPDGKIHPDFNQIVSTGRGSCTDPNLQNLPNLAAKKTGIDSHRRAIVASKGCRLVPADFSGQEFALMMFMSGEKEWLNHIRKGHDVHGLMSSRALGDMWKDEELKDCRFKKETKKCACPGHLKIRDDTKKTTFGIAYGKGPDATAVDIQSTVRFARNLINEIYRNAPKLKRYLIDNGRYGVKHRKSYTLPPFNRRRNLVEIAPTWHIRNQAINSPIQGAGGDMIKLAMVYLWREIKNNGWAARGAKLLLWIHDEIVTEVKTKHAEEWSKVVAECMERAAAIITGGERLIKAEVSIKEDLNKG